MVVELKRWGNSQGIRISKEIIDAIGIKINDELDLDIQNGYIVLKPVNKHKTLQERAQDYGGVLGPYDEYDWGQPVGRERW